MKFLQILVITAFVLTINFKINAQACESSFLTLFIEEHNGLNIANAKIALSSPKFSEKNQYEDEVIKVKHIKQNNAYSLNYNKCGDYSDVSLRISADEFNSLEQTIDLRFDNQAYVIKLGRLSTNQPTYSKQLIYLEGNVTDTDKIPVANAKVILAKTENGQKFETTTDEKGNYHLYAFLNWRYKIEVFGNDGIPITNFDELQLTKYQNVLNVILQNDSKFNSQSTQMVCKVSGQTQDISDCNIITKNPIKKINYKEEK